MSYTPTLVIVLNDLEKKAESWDREFLEIMDHSDLSDEAQAKKYLLDLLKDRKRMANENNGYVNTPTIKGIRLLICEPEFTSANKNVRELLDDEGIEYTIDY